MLETRRSLSLRLIISLGLLSLVASAVLAAIQFHFKYKSNISAVHESLNHVASGDLKSISASLWQLDTNLLDIPLQAFIARPNFMHAAIIQSGQAIVALILASTLLFLFQRQVGMHLRLLTAQVRDISSANLKRPIALDKKYRDDELDQLKTSLDTLLPRTPIVSEQRA